MKKITRIIVMVIATVFILTIILDITPVAHAIGENPIEELTPAQKKNYADLIESIKKTEILLKNLVARCQAWESLEGPKTTGGSHLIRYVAKLGAEYLVAKFTAFTSPD